MFFLRNFFTLGFTIFIFPIVVKKLGPENLGKIQYVEAIVAYFLLFINLGIDTYGKREVALYREDREKLSSIVLELIFILLITTIIGIIIYLINIKYLMDDIIIKKISMIYLLNIIFNFIGVEWFYIGIENQEYITKRNLFFKFLSAISILLFINSKNDMYIYVFIVIFSLVGSNLLNILNLKKYIVLKKIKIKDISKHLKPLFVLFFSVLSASIAHHLDSIMVKNIVGVKELGYYSFAMKFGKIPIVLTTTIVAVLYPRLCNLLGQNKKKEYYQLATIGIEIILLFSTPITIGMFLISDIIVKVFAGTDFLNSIPVMKVFSILILVMGIAYSTGSITLVANKRDKVYSLSVVLGALLNFIFNLLYIPKIGALGAAIATIITEVIAIIVRILFCMDIFKKIKISIFNLVKIIISSTFMGIVVYYIKNFSSNLTINLIFSIIFGGIAYSISLLLFKEKYIINFLEKLKNKFKE
ncbi:oligosaccharide flippase family protein [Fusobacterium perfoetens]|uniref:oligosaccharide flippase family protein n=1 Tax=Fusobacterium perfoetens TaxID=852 RepID=UPI001B809DD6|nr:oligosaccharide flippase family protein [Fusobacterium perfoetens]